MDTIAKKGEWVKIVDWGSAIPYYLSLNKPYQLLEDLNSEKGFHTRDNENEDDGWDNAFELNMKFEKVEPKNYD